MLVSRLAAFSIKQCLRSRKFQGFLRFACSNASGSKPVQNLERSDSLSCWWRVLSSNWNDNGWEKSNFTSASCLNMTTPHQVERTRHDLLCTTMQTTLFPDTKGLVQCCHHLRSRDAILSQKSFGRKSTWKPWKAKQMLFKKANLQALPPMKSSTEPKLTPTLSQVHKMHSLAK